MTTTTTDKAAEARRTNTDRIVEKVDEVREEARNFAVRAKERAVELEGEFEEYVKAHPVKSVAIAAGVGALAGFATGMLMGRR